MATRKYQPGGAPISTRGPTRLPGSSGGAGPKQTKGGQKPRRKGGAGTKVPKTRDLSIDKVDYRGGKGSSMTGLDRED